MASRMEIDGEPPPPLPGVTSNLKRCNSAPMINLLVDGTPPLICNGMRQTRDDTSKPDTTASLSSGGLFSLTPCSSNFRPVDTASRIRSRHYSTSSLVPATQLASGVLSPIKVPSRVHQIKRDEEVQTNVHREIKHEREIQSAMQMSQSWDEHFTLEDPTPAIEPHKSRPRSLSESLHIFTSGFPVASSPSPTRVGKQCFSPSMQAPVILNGNFNFSPSPSPSPTRRVARRSLSPIVTLKPSSLSHKRKIDTDSDSGFSQPKRIFTGSLLSPASLQLASQSNQLVQQVHHNNLRLGLDFHGLRQHTYSSLSTGSFDDSASEHSSTSTVNTTTPSLASSVRGGFSPLPPNDNYSTTTTDSENDMFECNTNSNNNNTSGNMDSRSSSNSSSSTSVSR